MYVDPATVETLFSPVRLTPSLAVDLKEIAEQAYQKFLKQEQLH